MTWTVSTSPDEFDEALGWFLSRLPMTRQEWDALSVEARRKAFMVSNVAQADMVYQVWQALDRAIAKGQTLAQFRKAVSSGLTSAWGKNDPWREETIFRTNVQSAYSAGRVKQMKHPAVTKVRPYWSFDAVLDIRTTEICEPLDGVTLPQDDPFWATHSPPLHFSCRSGLRSLRETEAKAQPKYGEKPAVAPQAGFGALPGEAEWEPEVSKYPPALQSELKKRLSNLDSVKPMPAPKQIRSKPSSR